MPGNRWRFRSFCVTVWRSLLITAFAFTVSLYRLWLYSPPADVAALFAEKRNTVMRRVMILKMMHSSVACSALYRPMERICSVSYPDCRLRNPRYQTVSDLPRLFWCPIAYLVCPLDLGESPSCIQLVDNVLVDFFSLHKWSMSRYIPPCMSIPISTRASPHDFHFSHTIT